MDVDALFSYSPLWFLFKGFIWDVLVAVLRPLPLVLPFSMVVMFASMYAREHGWTARDFAAQAARAWKSAFTGSAVFRTEFLFVFYVMLVMSRTLLFRPTHPYPLSDMLGGWDFYDLSGDFTLEAVENFILFIPFGLLLSSVLHKTEQLESRSVDAWVLRRAALASAVFSLSIECLQVMLYVGTFQLADLFYNSAGGAFGALLFCLYAKIKAMRA
jgi:glycopeptide antibiotics resistance protein